MYIQTKRLLDYSALNYRALQGLGEKATESNGASLILPPTMSPLCFTLPLSATLSLCSTLLPLIILWRVRHASAPLII